MNIEPIAYFHSPIEGKFGLPRQSGLAESLHGEIVLIEKYRQEEALRGLEGFDYIWLIWGFHLNREDSSHDKLTVRPPRLGGNERIGVFASRSPYRPNPIGLSSVKIERIIPQKGIIEVLGADIANGTPIYDIKPYIEYADSHSGIRSGFTDTREWKSLNIYFECKIPERLSHEDLSALECILSQNPKPQYQHDPNRIYHIVFNGIDFHFTVDGDSAIVVGTSEPSPATCKR
ncbi:MAG TPA: tRNA (N6-threonylcarbamoyladenosine(37)-N6)-methyltransferase TrmO [Rikenellaceae bacterium]|nr:tRNA (N6-threonylcarbamoyladenosine(37)-N6)-methyltransferase TrmO [Rikenellaceae bacterium]